jgi:hypothetical protein
VEALIMPFRTDAMLAAEPGQVFGQYISTFDSVHGQVRADLFRVDDRLEAHVSFRHGFDASNVTDRYVSELWRYARDNGYADRLRLVLSEASTTETNA